MNEMLSQPAFRIAAIALVALLAAVVAFAWPRTGGHGGITTVSVQDMHAAISQGALVLDVREPYEFDEGHVAGTVLVPLATVAARAGEFDKSAPVYVFCRSGNRSLVAAQTLADAGYGDVRNVDGGMIAWASARLPIER
jgi:rhodanese-related sulfurtransferase